MPHVPAAFLADTPVLAGSVIFLASYLVFALGKFPGLKIDRTGAAIIGATAMVVFRIVPGEQAIRAVDFSTIVLLFAMMLVVGGLKLAGFFEWNAELILRRLKPGMLLPALILTCGLLSAFFVNDIVCLVMVPFVLVLTQKLHLPPLAFLLAVATSSNIGSVATITGNPQNMLIGATLQLSFAGYLHEAAPPVLVGLVATWGLILWQSGGRLTSARGLAMASSETREVADLNRWQTAKGLTVTSAIVLCFVFTSLPREVVALTGAGVLLMSRKLHSRNMLGLVDWELLVLFMGLFVVNHALQKTGLPARVMGDLASAGVPLQHPGPLFAATFVLSNIVSNVPAVMLLLPSAQHSLAGPTLALVSTLSGNLLVIGSIANIIVVDAAARRGVPISWRSHARVGVPVTLVTLAITAGYLALRLRAGA